MAEKTLVDDEKSVTQPSGRSYFPPSQRKVHDSDVTFEEYHFYAQRTREEQRLLTPPKWQWRTAVSSLFSSKDKTGNHSDDSSEPVGRVITEDEWTNASRAFRTASWGAIFYLVSRFW
jgi:hypothetical protein